MTNKLFIASAMLLLLQACGDDEPGGAPDQDSGSEESTPDAATDESDAATVEDAGEDASDTEDDLPPLEPGFERYTTVPVDVEPGTSTDWAQWVGGPLDQDYDVIAIRGTQWGGGHHALMYATTEAQEPGFTRRWEDADQLTTRLTGGVGGEGGANATLPEGVVFRVQKGSYLVVQTHYLNTTEETISAHSVLDVKLEPVDKSRIVASIMSSTDLAVSITPGDETTMDVYCEIQSDLKFIQTSNHMHEYGVSTFTEFTDPSGETHMIKDDDDWTYEWALNPNFDHFPVEEPLLVPAGSMLHTQCTWENTTTEEITFPAEMCVFFGFILGNADITCSAGEWINRGEIDSE
jgi:hypothetical protein